MTQVFLGFWDGSSDRPELEWWWKLNVWSIIIIGCLIDLDWWCSFFEELSLGVSACLRVLVVFLWGFFFLV